VRAAGLKCCKEPGGFFSIIPSPVLVWARLQKVFPLYETIYDGLIVNHSHNDYAEVLAETA